MEGWRGPQSNDGAGAHGCRATHGRRHVELTVELTVEHVVELSVANVVDVTIEQRVRPTVGRCYSERAHSGDGHPEAKLPPDTPARAEPVQLAHLQQLTAVLQRGDGADAVRRCAGAGGHDRYEDHGRRSAPADRQLLTFSLDQCPGRADSAPGGPGGPVIPHPRGERRLIHECRLRAELAVGAGPRARGLTLEIHEPRKHGPA